MISLDPVVAVLLGHVPGRGQQVIQHPQVDRCLVGGHLHRTRRLPQRPDEEPARRGGIALRRGEHVDDLPELVHRPVQVTPPACHLHVGLIDEPPITRGSSTGAGGVSEQRCEPLHPPVDGDVVDLDAALGE